MLIFWILKSVQNVAPIYCPEGQCCNKMLEGKLLLTGSNGVAATTTNPYFSAFSSTPRFTYGFSYHYFYSASTLSSLILESSRTVGPSSVYFSTYISGPSQYALQVSYLATEMSIYFGSLNLRPQSQAGKLTYITYINIYYTNPSTPLGNVFVTRFNCRSQSGTNALGMHITVSLSLSRSYPLVSFINPGRAYVNYVTMSFVYFNAYAVRANPVLKTIEPFNFNYRSASVTSTSYSQDLQTYKNVYPIRVAGTAIMSSTGFTFLHSSYLAYSLGMSLGSDNLITAAVLRPQISLSESSVGIGLYTVGIFAIFQQRCASSLFLDAQQNQCIQACPSGTFGNSCFVCIDCHDICFTCSSALETNCLSCNASLFRVLIVSSCLCAPGYFVQNNLCVPCQIPCGQCVGLATNCTACIADFNLVLPSRVCIFCDIAQQLVFVNNQCVCISNSVSLGNSCSPCSSGCASCSGSATNCLSCIASHNFIPSSNSCLYCNRDLNLFFDPLIEACRCLPNFNQLTLHGSGCIQCIYPKVYDSQSQVCVCTIGYFHSGSTCTACSAGCQTCLNQKFCSLCFDSFNLIAEGEETRCLHCDVSLGQHFNVTIKNCLCSVGFFDNATRLCNSCHPSCFTCTDSGFSDCLSCDQTANKMLVSQSALGHCECMPGFAGPLRSSIGCRPCHPHCVLCSTPFQVYSCIECRPSRTLVFGSCQCPPGSYQQDGQCFPCSRDCLVCTRLLDCKSCAGTTVMQLDFPSIVCAVCQPKREIYNTFLKACQCREHYLRVEKKCQLFGVKNSSQQYQTFLMKLLEITNQTRAIQYTINRLSILLGVNANCLGLIVDSLLLRMHLLSAGTLRAELQILLSGLDAQLPVQFIESVKNYYQSLLGPPVKYIKPELNYFLAQQFPNGRMFIQNLFQFFEPCAYFALYLLCYSFVYLIFYLTKKRPKSKIQWRLSRLVFSVKLKPKFFILYIEYYLFLASKSLGQITDSPHLYSFNTILNNILAVIVLTSILALGSLMLKHQNKVYFKNYLSLFCKHKSYQKISLPLLCTLAITLRMFIVPLAMYLFGDYRWQLCLSVFYNLSCTVLIYICREDFKAWKIQYFSCLFLAIFQLAITISISQPIDSIQVKVLTFISIAFVLAIVLLNLIRILTQLIASIRMSILQLRKRRKIKSSKYLRKRKDIIWSFIHSRKISKQSNYG